MAAKGLGSGPKMLRKRMIRMLQHPGALFWESEIGEGVGTCCIIIVSTV